MCVCFVCIKAEGSEGWSQAALWVYQQFPLEDLGTCTEADFVRDKVCSCASVCEACLWGLHVQVSSGCVWCDTIRRQDYVTCITPIATPIATFAHTTCVADAVRCCAGLVDDAAPRRPARPPRPTIHGTLLQPQPLPHAAAVIPQHLSFCD